MPEPGKAKLAAVGRERGYRGVRTTIVQGRWGKKNVALPKRLFLSPTFSSRISQRGSQPRFSSGHFPSLVAGADRH